MANAKGKYNPQPQSSTLTYILGGIAVAVIAVLVIGGVIWQSNCTKSENLGYVVSNTAVQLTYGDNGVVTLGVPGAPKHVEVYEDALCPYCSHLEEQSGGDVAKAVDEGKAQVSYHLLNFLNRGSASGDYSSRAAAALQCVAQDSNASAYSKFHTKLFATDYQPGEGSKSDHSNDQLADAVRDAGGSEAAVSCTRDGARVDQAATDAQAASAALQAVGAQGTPTVTVDGIVVDALGNANWVTEQLG